jgi:hypothetical protein
MPDMPHKSRNNWPPVLPGQHGSDHARRGRGAVRVLDRKSLVFRHKWAEPKKVDDPEGAALEQSERPRRRTGLNALLARTMRLQNHSSDSAL